MYADQVIWLTVLFERNSNSNEQFAHLVSDYFGGTHVNWLHALAHNEPYRFSYEHRFILKHVARLFTKETGIMCYVIPVI